MPLALVGVLCASACNQPTYVDARGALEVGRPMDAGGANVPTAEAFLPIHELRDNEPDDSFRVRRDKNQMLAMQRATEFNVTPEEAPWLLRDDIAIQVDWTLKNLEDMPGVARVMLNGANEFVMYDPGMVELGEDEDPPPSLLGGTPFEVPALGIVNGTFREDQLDEAMLDLDLIRRTPDPQPTMPGMMVTPVCPPCGNAFQAILQRPSALPADRLVAGMHRISVALVANRHMVLDFVVRVREKTDGVVAGECSQLGGNGRCHDSSQMIDIPTFDPDPTMFGVTITP